MKRSILIILTWCICTLLTSAQTKPDTIRQIIVHPYPQLARASVSNLNTGILMAFTAANEWTAHKATDTAVWVVMTGAVDQPTILLRRHYIGSTFKTLDSTYSVKDNKPMLSVAYRYRSTEYGGQWEKATITFRYKRGWFSEPVSVTVEPYDQESEAIVIIGDFGPNDLVTWTREATPVIFKINDDQSVIFKKPKKHKPRGRFSASTSKTKFLKINK